MDLKELTKDGIQQLLVCKGDSILSIDLQIIEVNTSEKILQGVVSDGFVKHDVYFSKEADTKLNTILPFKSKAIIQVKKAITKMSSYLMVVIFDFNFVNDKYQTLIGYPLSYPEYESNSFTNSKGSNVIKQIMPVIKTESKPVTAVNINPYKQQSENKASLSNTTTQSQTKPKPSITMSGNKKPNQGAIQRINEERDMSLLHTPINSLYPMMQKWCIKARVTSKSDVRTFVNKSKGQPGQFFTIDILDNDKGTINCTFFNEASVKFFNIIQQGKVYEFSEGSVKVPRQSSGGNQSKYQINFEAYSYIKEVEDDKQIEAQTFKITKIVDIPGLANNTIIDVIAIVKDDVPLESVKVKGEPVSKRTFFIFDQTGGIEVTLWAQTAQNNDLAKDEIIGLKGMRVAEYMNAKNLAASSQTSIIRDKDQLNQIKEFAALSEWYQINQGNIQIDAPAAREGKQNSTKSCIDLENEGQQNESKAQWKQFSEVIAYVSALNTKQTFHYKSCTKCSKKAEQQQNGYSCPSCMIEFDEPIYKYIINGKIADASGAIWVTFNDQGIQTLFDGLKCKEYVEMNDDQKQQVNEKAKNQEHRFLILSQYKEYQGNSKLNHQVTRFIANPDYSRETLDLLRFIN